MTVQIKTGNRRNYVTVPPLHVLLYYARYFAGMSGIRDLGDCRFAVGHSFPLPGGLFRVPRRE